MQRAAVDYLKLRVKNEPSTLLEAIRPIFTCGEHLTLDVEEKGRDGWESRRTLMLFDKKLGYMDYGGGHMRGWLRFFMSGEGCAWVHHWELLEGLLKPLKSPELMRVDLKIDFTDGSVTHERVLAAHAEGKFKREKGGRNPMLKKVETSRLQDGKTVYIGARTSPRFIRCYEKGWELLKDVPETWKTDPDMFFDLEDGNGLVRVRDVYRVEVELKAVEDVVLPLACLTDRDGYFAGAAPFCAELVEAAPRRAYALPSEFNEKLALAAAMEHARRQSGGVWRALAKIYGAETVEQKARIFDLMTSGKVSEKLKSAGVLMLDL